MPPADPIGGSSQSYRRMGTARPLPDRAAMSNRRLDLDLGAHLSYAKIFWFTWKTLSGSYFRLSSTSR